ncbi:hypothetical protein FRC12_013653 [Ceratobasidium sp. 428]|nr:hypothetical protein FRC12_013653 [Ceratobasidium sp. 428]
MSDIGVMVAISAKEELPLRPENEMPAGQPYGDSLWELLMKCWQRVPEDRPPAEEAARIMSVVESCYPV